jgi:hypothetical protein
MAHKVFISLECLFDITATEAAIFGRFAAWKLLKSNAIAAG